jgi:hypothetical protein
MWLDAESSRQTEGNLSGRRGATDVVLFGGCRSGGLHSARIGDSGGGQTRATRTRQRTDHPRRTGCLGLTARLIVRFSVASVAVRWVVTEPGTEQATALLRQSIQWLASPLMPTEVASALRRKVVARELSTEVAFDALDALSRNGHRAGRGRTCHAPGALAFSFARARGPRLRLSGCGRARGRRFRDGRSPARRDRPVARCADDVALDRLSGEQDRMPSPSIPRRRRVR